MGLAVIRFRDRCRKSPTGRRAARSALTSIGSKDARRNAVGLRSFDGVRMAPSSRLCRRTSTFARECTNTAAAAYIVRDGTVYCVNFSDQRVYRIVAAGALNSMSVPEALTPAGPWRYADFDVDVRRQRLICVREDHTHEGREPINTIVSIPIGPVQRTDGPAEAGHYVSWPRSLPPGYDFYSTPRLSPDGTRLAWLSWRHPAMPWDATELWVADVDANGTLCQCDARSRWRAPNQSTNLVGRRTAHCIT